MNIKVSQANVATSATCNGIINHHFVANLGLLLNPLLKEV